jgi:CrcB protein
MPLGNGDVRQISRSGKNHKNDDQHTSSSGEHAVKNFAAVFLGGGIGAVCRYWLSGVVYRWLPPTFPFGNLIVNVSGCFLIGVLMTALNDRFSINPAMRLFLVIGILGGFTTFSSFSYETVSLVRDNQIVPALLNVAGSVIGCLVATVIGTYAGRLI